VKRKHLSAVLLSSNNLYLIPDTPPQDPIVRRRLTTGYGRLFLIALIPGVILPAGFFLLFAATTKATGRDIFPSLSSPGEVVGCFGFALTGFTLYAIMAEIGSLINSVHQAGLIIPLFDSLSANLQSMILIVAGFVGNSLVFFTPLALGRALLRLPSPPAESTTVETNNHETSAN
jgi:hypothetical protein